MDYKVYVKDEETSKKVQEHAFKLGYSWGKDKNEVNNKQQPFLYFEDKKKIIFFDTIISCSFEEFKKEAGTELTPEEFLALPICTTWVCPTCTRRWKQPITEAPVCPVCEKFKQNKTASQASCTGCWVTGKRDKSMCETCFDFSNKETCKERNDKWQSKEQNKLFDPDKMIEIDAYKISMEMWEFLAGDPKREKRDWYKYKAYLIERMKGNCPVCHFLKGNCSECYLSYEGLCKGNKNSETIAYYFWINKENIPEERQRAAKEIYNALHSKYFGLCSTKTQIKYTHEQIMTGWFEAEYAGQKRWRQVTSYYPDLEDPYVIEYVGHYNIDTIQRLKYAVLPPEDKR